jgi:hypothetical protein
LLYTVGENLLRIDVTGSDRPNPIDIVDLKSGAKTLVFPHNRSFVRLKPASESREAGTAASAPAMPTPPPGIGPQAQPNSAIAGRPGAPPFPTPPGGLPPGIGPQSRPGEAAPGFPTMPPMPGRPEGAGIPSMPPMPMMPPMMSEKIELKPTGKKEKILGFECQQYEIKQRGETMEIWATDKLLPFQPYVRNQQPRFGPRMLEEQWPELLTAKKLFPLRVSLHFDMPAPPTSRSPAEIVTPAGAERFRFEVKSVTPEKVKDEKLFQSPEGYNEIQPLPF